MTQRPTGVRWTRLLALVVTAALLPVAVTWSTFGDDPKPDFFKISTTSGPPGTYIKVTGDCGPNAAAERRSASSGGVSARLSWSGSELRKDYTVSQVLPFRDGLAVAGRIRVPDQAPGGEYRLALSCQFGDDVSGSQNFAFTVTGVGSPPGIHRAALRVAPDSGPPGSTVLVSGHCRLFGAYPASVAGQFFDSPASARTTSAIDIPASTNGEVARLVTVPRDLPAGTVTLSLTCSSDGVEFGGQVIDFRVEKRRTSGPAVPNTGS